MPSVQITPRFQFRVALVSPRYYPEMGGVQTHVHEIAPRLRSLGADVTILTTNLTKHLPSVELISNVRVLRFRAWPRDRDYFFSPGLYRAIRTGKYDIVHCHSANTLVPPMAMIAAWQAHIPFVLTFHTGGNPSGVRNALRSMQYLVLRPLLARASRLIGVSQFEAKRFERLLRLPKERFIIIPNGSHLPPPTLGARPDPDHPLLISIGRLERFKGHHRAIEALPMVLKTVPTARLLILGTGPYEAALRDLARNLGVSEHVEIDAIPAEERERMATVLSGAALVMLLSDYEAHPIAVMEALGLQRPVLVTDTSGLSELAERGLVRSIPLSSTPEMTARAIVGQLHDPLIPEHVVLPTWDDCSSRLMDIYRNAIEKR